MKLALDTSDNKVIDITSELNQIGNIYKDSAKELLKRFDFESTNDLSKTKHYPFDMLCAATPEDLNSALEVISKALWSTFYKELQAGYVSKGVISLSAHDVGGRSMPVNLKIGKVYVSPPNNFTHINTEVAEVMPFAFTYKQDDKYEIMSEINFSIELY